MSSQRDPNRQAVMCYVPMEIAVKLKTLVSGKMVKNKVKKGFNVHKKERPMGMSDYMIELVEKAVANVKPSRNAIKWANEKLKKNIKTRKVQDDKVKNKVK